MNRRAFLLGAIAAPVAAPMIAKAASPVVGVDLARGGSVTSLSQMVVGECGAEMVLPRAMAERFGLPLGTVRNFRIVREMADGEEVAWTGAGKVVDVLEGGPSEITVDVTFPSLRHPDT